MNTQDRLAAEKRYNERLSKFGYSEEALGWTKNKNDLRFAALLAEWNQELNGSSVCDFGCGFGDLFGYIQSHYHPGSFQYFGIEINQNLVNVGRELYPDAEFWVGDIVSQPFERNFDFVFSSGVFNHKLSFQDEYEFISDCLNKLNQISRKGYAVNFLSDKVDFQLDHTFHSNPGKILDIAFRHSRNVVLRNDYMPFEFTVYVRKDIPVDPVKVCFVR
jgi:SAM-dependent methyltransferase